jgi:putative SOS response-associated peptidase YedK
VAVAPNDGLLKLDFYVWGLIPSWAKDPAIGSRMINARGETLAEKPSFRSAFRRRRCLIPADGFYEWQQVPGHKTKTPMYIRLKSGEPFAFAGLWESWNAPDGSNILSCTIITTSPNALMQPIHNRMPVILPASAYAQWLEPGEQNPADLQPLLQAYPPEEMTAYPVSTLVNRPENDVAACIQPA